MSETDVPVQAPAAASTASGGVAATAEPRKLDDVLLAMDVVDTLRHRERIASLELDAEAREAELIQRLKEIYEAQGINVPERILKDGVRALEEQRFVYRPPTGGLSVALAKAYVSRDKWLGQAMVALLAIVLVSGAAGFQHMRSQAEWRNMPAEIRRLSEEAQNLAADPEVDARVAAIEAAAHGAVEARDRSAAHRRIAALQDIRMALNSEYELRIVSRPGEDTGFYRVSDDLPGGRNYYIVVEPVAPSGEVLTLPVTSEETQSVSSVSRWAQRVDETTFNRIAEDKADDQIVQDNVLGTKRRGELEPQFSTRVPGGAITQW